MTLLFVANAQVKNFQNTNERLKSLLQTKETKSLNSSLRNLEKSKNEADRMLAYAYYNEIDNEEKANALQENIVKTFPNGQLALQNKLAEIGRLESLEEKDRKFQEFIKENPNAPLGIEMHYMSTAYADLGNVEKMKQYAALYRKSAKDIKGNPLDERRMLAGLATKLIKVNPKEAIPLLANGLAFYREELAKTDDGETEQKRAQRRINNEWSYYSTMVSYAEALLQTDKKAQGLELIAIMKNELAGKEVAQVFQVPYVNALLANERYADALPYIEEQYTKNTAAKDVETSLQKGYTATRGSMDAYGTYKTALDEAKAAYAKEQLMKKLISKEAPDFELKDVDGHTVRLADLKGKVVVLDFWATWCGPCKASFPMMQKAVNKYKDDQNVKFLFIHTWENGSGDPTLNAKKYITDNKYTFQVLMDLRAADTRVSAVAKAYEVTGIPAKFIIDINGRIRFDSDHIAADEDRAVEDLSTMIEFARKG